MSVGLKHSIVPYKAGAMIFKDGDSRTAMYVVHTGQIAIFKVTAHNERIPLGIIGSGEYLGENGLLDNKPIHETWAMALTDVELIRIPAEAILEQMKSAPPWLVALSKGLAQKLRKMNEVVRRNKLHDSSLDQAMTAAEQNEIKRKGAI